MAKQKNNPTSAMNSSVITILVIGIIAGFVGGYLFARDRYHDKISAISEMNMERAVTIDSLNQEIQVLGAKTQAGE